MNERNVKHIQQLNYKIFNSHTIFFCYFVSCNLIFELISYNSMGENCDICIVVRVKFLRYVLTVLRLSLNCVFVDTNVKKFEILQQNL